MLIVAVLAARSAFGQDSKPSHSWDVFMNTPEAREAGSKLHGHCGDAATQDVMNACYALEFKNAEQEMNSAFQAILKQLEAQDQAALPEAASIRPNRQAQFRRPARR